MIEKTGLRLFCYPAISHKETLHLLFGEFATRCFFTPFKPKTFHYLVVFPVAC